MCAVGSERKIPQRAWQTLLRSGLGFPEYAQTLAFQTSVHCFEVVYQVLGAKGVLLGCTCVQCHLDGEAEFPGSWSKSTWASLAAKWSRLCLQFGRCRLDPRIWKIPWRRKWQPIPVFLPGKSHGQKSAQASVHGVAELDTVSDWALTDKLCTCCLAYKVFFPLSSQVSLTTTFVRWLNTYNSCLLSRQTEVQRWVFWPESLSIQ